MNQKYLIFEKLILLIDLNLMVIHHFMITLVIHADNLITLY